MSAPTYNDLVGQWRRQPTASGAVAACDSLALQAETGGARQPTLARSMADEASRAYPHDLEVLLSVGRMLLAHGQLQMAKRHLLGAAKLSAEPRAPRLLGEVLLRQGDAKRAVRALQRAIHLGATDDETHGWYESASAYVSIQTEQGREAVSRAVDEGFQAYDDLDIADEDSEDDAPTMVSTAPHEALMAMVQADAPSARVSEAASALKAKRPERPAIPRDDEATAFVQLQPEAQDGAPTRVAADVPPQIASAPLPGETPFAPARGAAAREAAAREAAAREAAAREAAAQASPMPAPERVAAPTAAAEAPSSQPSQPQAREMEADEFPLDGIADESTAVMSNTDIATLNQLEARRSKVSGIKDEPTDRVAPPAEKPAKKISDEDSDDAWHLAVKKGPTEATAPSVRARPSATRRKSNRTGMYVVAAGVAILFTLFAGVRTGRLPEIAQHLPGWLSGEQSPVATPDVAAEPAPAAQETTPDPEPAKQAKNDDPPPPVAEAPVVDPDPTPAAEPSAAPAAQPSAAQPASAPAPVSPRPAAPRPRPNPQPAKPDPPPAPKPAAKPDPGAPEVPLWLGDPERE